MDSQILYLIIGVLVGAIAIYFFVKKNGNSGDNSVLSSQLADLIVRFSKVEEATKNISSTQASIDNTFKSFEGMLNDRQERGAFSEMELEKLLKDRLPSQYLKFQHTLSNNKRVDCLIDLGENSQKIGKWEVEDILIDIENINGRLEWKQFLKNHFGKETIEIKDLENWDLSKYLKNL